MSSEAKGSEEAKSPEEIRAEIDDTREDLGETVAAAAEKSDVKAQAQAKVEEAKSKAKELGEKARAAAPESPAEAQQLAKQNPKPLAVAAAVLGLLLLWRLLRR